LPAHIIVTSSLEEALRNSRVIINVVPVQHIRNVWGMAKPYIPDNSVLVNASKGIEVGTNLTASRIIKEITGIDVSVLSGPSFAKEVASRLPTAVTIASEDYTLALLLQEMFNTDYFRVYTHHDVIGVEIAGAIKNVIAIASGISDGLGLGFNARAALITRGLSEITRLGVMLGAKEYTFSGLSGLGDLVLTCTAPLSRNYTVGFELGRGTPLSEIISSRRTVAEGVETTKGAKELAALNNIEMPIVEQVYSVLFEGKEPKMAVSELMNRTPKPEFYG